METWLRDRIEASTDPYLPPKLPKQNQHSKQGYRCNQNTGVHTLHEYFTSNQRDRNKGRKEDPKQNSNIEGEEDKIQSFIGMTKEPSKRVLMQILPVKVKTIDGRTAKTYALLDNGSQSTLIRDYFAQGLK